LAGNDVLAHGSGRSRLRDVLIGAQVGMSVVLLAGAALFLRAERSIAVRSPSVDAAHVLTAAYSAPVRSSSVMSPLTTRLEQIPGVRSVAYAAAGGDSGSIASLVVEGRAIETTRSVPVDIVSASYFETLRLPLLQGRGFAGADAAATVRPLVVSDALAAVWWPNGGALGARVTAGDGRRFDVVGIVHPDVAFVGGTADTIQAFTLAPVDPPSGTLFLRFDGDAAALTPVVRDVLRDMNSDVPATPITLAASDAATASKFMPLVEMVGSLGVTAIVLALVGVYGVVSFAVGRRAREIGVRSALGATPADIVRLVLATGAPPVAAGVVGGLLLTIPGAIALTRLFRYTPVPLRAADPVPYAIVVIALFGVSLATMLAPARRAARIAPSAALRSE
ncbi:MAG TPA: FtsX-like permease family protein, partial [Vicinamibacterales bacterium]